jgi:hypothetical protein
VGGGTPYLHYRAPVFLLRSAFCRLWSCALASIHPSAWKGLSAKSAFKILHNRAGRYGPVHRGALRRRARRVASLEVCIHHPRHHRTRRAEERLSSRIISPLVLCPSEEWAYPGWWTRALSIHEGE